jgi:hypothetical protein
MAFFESPELIRLFQVYTASPNSIGAHFAVASERATSDHPLLVATGTDLALYPGGGAPPTVDGFRLGLRGFKELTAVSHLGPAVATLARLKELDPSGLWRTDTERLLAATRDARLANSVELWRDQIGVAAFVGRQAAIAAMIDYTCRVTERVLERALAEPGYLTAAHLRRDYLAGPSDELPVPINRVMVATFFLAGMDFAHRLIDWFDQLELPWERTMVIVAGRQGRPTAGVTRDTNSVAGIIETVARGRLPRTHLLIAPHAPVFPRYDGSNLDQVAALEHEYRVMWSSMLATSDLGEHMFAGYPRYEPLPRNYQSLTPGTRTVSEMPTVTRPNDWHAMVTRLRVVMEDPRQLLSGAVTDYASRQLVQNDNDPSRITVPGLDAEDYPPLTRVHQATTPAQVS